MNNNKCLVLYEDCFEIRCWLADMVNNVWVSKCRTQPWTTRRCDKHLSSYLASGRRLAAVHSWLQECMAAAAVYNGAAFIRAADDIKLRLKKPPSQSHQLPNLYLHFPFRHYTRYFHYLHFPLWQLNLIFPLPYFSIAGIFSCPNCNYPVLSRMTWS
jgi:hypothetical protein